MKIEEFTLFNVSTNGDGEKTPSTRLTPNALPERGNSYAVVESSTGVSTRYARFKKALEQETFLSFNKKKNKVIFVISDNCNTKTFCGELHIYPLKTLLK